MPKALNRIANAFAGLIPGRRSKLLTIAMDNMSQGIVMFDSAERLVVCNDRYLEIYGMSPDVVKPGCKLIDLIRHRFSTGNIQRDPETYRQETLAAVAGGKMFSMIFETPEGRSISVVNRPIDDGTYWIGTHEDITDRLVMEKQRKSLAEQE